MDIVTALIGAIVAAVVSYIVTVFLMRFRKVQNPQSRDSKTRTDSGFDVEIDL